MGMGDLSVGGKAGIQRGRGDQLPKPLLRHQMEVVELCISGGGELCEPPLHTGVVREGVGGKQWKRCLIR